MGAGISSVHRDRLSPYIPDKNATLKAHRNSSAHLSPAHLLAFHYLANTVETTGFNWAAAAFHRHVPQSLLLQLVPSLPLLLPNNVNTSFQSSPFHGPCISRSSARLRLIARCLVLLSNLASYCASAIRPILRFISWWSCNHAPMHVFASITQAHVSFLAWKYNSILLTGIIFLYLTTP